MTLEEEYRDDLSMLIGRIGALDPRDLDARFASCFDLGRESYLRVRPSQEGTLAAVDGSNAMLLDAGYIAVALLRAAVCGYSRGTRRFRSVTPLRLATLGQEARDGSFAGLYRECFGGDPEAMVRDDEPERTAAVMRDTLEYWVALRAAERLGPGDLLVLDGALRVSHASHEPVMVRLIQICAKKGIHLCAVTKRTATTWGGGLPLVPAALALAKGLSVPPPWVLRIRDEGLDVSPYRQWRHGAPCVAALHPGSPLAFKIEVPAPSSDDVLAEIVSRLAGWADDGRITGYPYPLLDAHRTARIPADALQLVRNDLLAGLGRAGSDPSRMNALFGDLHDEFARY
ncbi:MAG: DNA double-strand break repair nuclease NurA [Methanomicrobiales archaeon]|nr:DNA double-strand break repair nuclease NurA [Methanomicrobiales archaeon]MDD1669649.1 DNA double-strand break repair nuclease NurA [Methanomicrobiales archaeon]